MKKITIASLGALATGALTAPIILAAASPAIITAENAPQAPQITEQTAQALAAAEDELIPGGTSFSEGAQIVGTDIQPGTYRSSALEPNLCYWERLSGQGGSLEEVIENDFGKVAPVVTIEASDMSFNSSGCGSWTLVSEGADPANDYDENGDFVGDTPDSDSDDDSAAPRSSTRPAPERGSRGDSRGLGGDSSTNTNTSVRAGDAEGSSDTGSRGARSDSNSSSRAQGSGGTGGNRDRDVNRSSNSNRDGNASRGGNSNRGNVPNSKHDSESRSDSANAFGNGGAHATADGYNSRTDSTVSVTPGGVSSSSSASAGG